jgi:hypothetical protein
LALGLIFPSRLAVGSESPWRVSRPFLIVGLVYCAAYFVLPFESHASGFSNRFPYLAVLAFVFAWEPPGEPIRRGALLAGVLGLATWNLMDLTTRFRAFDAETRGASELFNLIGPRETLYYRPAARGFSPAFGASGNKAMIELEQYASIRHGGLPNSSFAGYPFSYVRYVDGKNPMPGWHGAPVAGPALAQFDYLLMKSAQVPPASGVWPIEHRTGWVLYAVCGSRRFPHCPSW